MINKLNELCMWLSHQKGMMSKDYAKDLAKIIIQLQNQEKEIKKLNDALTKYAHKIIDLQER